MLTEVQIKELLDKLIIDAIELCDALLVANTNLEKSMNSGHLLMAKSRYISGSQTVSVTQLPNSEFNALVTVKREEDPEPCSQNTFEVLDHKVDVENGYPNPLKWFGVLVPQSLHLARDQYRKSVDYVVEVSNLRLALGKVLFFIGKLRQRIVEEGQKEKGDETEVNDEKVVNGKKVEKKMGSKKEEVDTKAESSKREEENDKKEDDEGGKKKAGHKKKNNQRKEVEKEVAIEDISSLKL